MSLYDFISAINVAPLLLRESEVVVGESNSSILAKIAWRYRVRPGCIAKYLMQNSRGTLAFLNRDVAVSFNSATEKSAQIDERLARITGLSGHCGSYSYLGAFLDRGARGLISEGKNGVRAVMPSPWGKIGAPMLCEFPINFIGLCLLLHTV